MDKVQKYIENNKDRFLNELMEFLEIPSISADSEYKKDVLRAAKHLKDKLLEAGLSRADLFSTPGHPILYAERIIDKEKPTVLVYGHYDVQPPDPLDLWDSPPFEPVIKKTDIHPEGAIYARGACDDKGQLFMHVKAFEAMNRSENLSCNVKFLLEGEEEVGSENLEKFCRDHKDLLSCDMVLVSDTSLLSYEHPTITVGLRGLSYVEVEVTGPNKDLHSGTYGGAVANPVNVLCEMIASLKDENQRINIPGFYDKVVELTKSERDIIRNIPFDEEAYMRELGVEALRGESGYHTLERTSTRPTLDVNGIWGGYSGEGAKTVLPSKASAKISMRLVPDQDPDEITELFSKHFKSLAPEGVKVKVRAHHGGKPVLTPVDTPEYKAASQAMEKTFGKPVIPLRTGGSIPIVALFDEVFDVKTVLVGFGLDSDDIHSPNEHFGLRSFFKGIETIPYFYHFYSAMKENNHS